MSGVSIFDRTRRAVHFARHIPISKLVRRVELQLRRRLRDTLPRTQDPYAATPRRATTPPSPLFAPRGALAPTRENRGWRFEFLHRPVHMAGPTVDWVAPGLDATNQLWRMNLHYMEYLESLDESDCIELIEDWIVSNPANRPGNWRDSWNSYALSLRVVVWLQELARRASKLNEESVRHIEASAAAQLVFLEENLETDLGGNHLIKNIKALLWAAAYFTGPQAERWRRRGLQLLEDEIRVQVLSDGVHYERSPSYHCQVFADLLECRYALGGDPLDGKLDGALRRMAQATADLSHPDGGVALLNDAGLTMAYSPGACLDAYAKIFGEPPVARQVFAFPEAGYFGLRGDGTYLLVDCGRIAPDDLPAHGHGDVLSFEWSAGGRRIVVDQGVYEYVEGERRNASRSAMSHNTLCYEGTDQAEFFGSFRCGRRPNVQALRWKAGTNGFLLEGTHDGFSHLRGAPGHVRLIVANPTSVDIIDRVEGAAERSAKINFLLHPEIVATQRSEEIELSQSGLRITFNSSSSAELAPAVWWPDMGVETATTRIVVHLAAGQEEVRTSFRIISGDTCT